MREIPLHALLVTAHPGTRSVNTALRDVIRTALRDTGYDVLESDLYAMGWDPVVSLADFGAAADPTAPVGDQSGLAYARGELSPDITAEQEKIRAASLLVFQFPLWWYGMPAILKGWFDRVFVQGFAFGVKDEHGKTRKYGDGGLAGKRALAVITAGDRETAFHPRGLNGDAASLLFPFLHGIFWYTGLAPLHPHLIGGVDRPGWDDLDETTARLRKRILGLDAEDPIPYRRLADGDYDPDRVLLPHLRPGETSLDIHVR